MDVNASRRLLAGLPVLAAVLLVLSGPVASLRSTPPSAPQRRPPLPGAGASALPRRDELHLERGTGAYERQYWYEYDRSTWDGKRQTFPRGAEVQARRVERQLRTDRGFPDPLQGFDPDLTNIGWKSLGPRPIRVEDSGFDETEVAGRVTALAVLKGPGRMVIGSASGGIWSRLVDPPGFAQPRSDHEVSLSIGCMAAAPSNPSILYAGTGEPGVSSDAFLGWGMLKSTDGGIDWARIDDGSLSVTKITQVWVHPANPNHVLASILRDQDTTAGGGLLRSTNGGVSWTPLAEATGPGMTFAVHPTNPNRILYSRSHPFGTTDADLLWSNDGGDHFFPVNGPWLGTGQYIGRIDLAFSPSDPDVVWASVAPSIYDDAFDSGMDGIYYSSNGGFGWGKISTSHHRFIDPDTGKLEEGIGWYTNPIAVSPTDSNTVYLGGVNLYRYVVGQLKEPLTNWKRPGPYGVHGDQHVILPDPDDPNTIYLGNDGGVYVTHNGGETWQHRNHGLGITQFYYGSVGKNNAMETVLGASQDNGTSRWLGHLSTWLLEFKGDGLQLAGHPEDDQVIFGSQQYCRYKVSYNGGLNWDDVAPLPLAEEDPKPFFTPLGVEMSGGEVDVYGGAQRLYRRQGAGTGGDWDTVGGIVFPNDPFDRPTHFRRIAPAAGDTIWASGGPFLGYSTDGGQSWAQVNNHWSYYGPAFTDIEVDPNDAAVAYVTRAGTFNSLPVKRYRVSGGGFVEKNLSATLPLTTANGIVTHLEGPGPFDQSLHAYLATDTGVYYTNLYQPGPIQWDPIGEGLPNSPVYDVQLANDGKQLIAYTHGRGAWCIDTDTIVKPTYYLACEPGIPLEAGATVDGYAVFTRPPKRGTTARVVSSNPRALSVPRLAQFRPGKVSATFPLRARPVTNPTWVTITATVNGVARSFRVLVLPRRQGGRAP